MTDALAQIACWLAVFGMVGGVAAFNLRRDEIKRRKRARAVGGRW